MISVRGMYRKLLVLFILTGLVVFPSLNSAIAQQTGIEAPPEVLPLESIEKGMTGQAKTVVQGNTVSTFQVRVIGIIDKPGYLEDFIIVRASGEAIDNSGGIAQGMSGSPVYLDGRLIGALSRAALWTRTPDKPLGLVTPIETMLRIMPGNAGSNPNPESTGSTQSQKDAIVSGLSQLFPAADVHFAEPSFSGSRKLSERNSLLVYPLQSPIYVSGMGKRAYKYLKKGVNLDQFELLFNPVPPTLGNSGGYSYFEERFSGLGFNVRRSSVDTGGEVEGMNLEPGRPVGAALALGDISIGALGTVTYRKDNSVLAFGHRFLHFGATDFFLTRAHIFDTVQSLEASYKLGTLTGLSGSVTQDRAQGILGNVERTASDLKLDLEVIQKEANAERDLDVNLVRDSQLIGPLTYPILMEGINRSLNRVGPGTVKVRYTIDGKNMPQELSRTDIFFSYSDVSLLPSLQVALIMDALALNPFQEADLTDLTASAEVSTDISTGLIFSLITDSSVYHPGESIAYQVKINKYREGVTSKTGLLKLPESTPEGKYVVAAYGGPRPPEVAIPMELTSFKDYVSYIESLNNFEHLSVELLQPLSEDVVPMSDNNFRYKSINRTDQRFQDRVIYGRRATIITVVSAENGEEDSLNDSGSPDAQP